MFTFPLAQTFFSKKYFSIYFIFFVSFCFSQETNLIDSLKLKSYQVQDTVLVDVYDEISWEYKNSNMDSAFFYAKKALSLAKQLKHQKTIANSYNTVGSNFEYISNFDSALYYYEKSLHIKEKINDSLGIANSLNNLGIVHDEKGNHQKALTNYFKALRIYETLPVDFDKIPMVLVNIGIVYKKQGNYQKVLEYYQRALKIYESNNYDVGIVITKGNIGNTLLKLKKYEEAINYSTEAKKMYDELGYNRYVPYMNVQIANAKDSLKQYEEARVLYTNAIKSFEEDKNYQELADAKIGLSNNYFMNNLFLDSKKEISEALEIIKEKGLKDFEIRALEVLHKTNFKLGNYKEAYLNTLNFIEQNEALFEKEKVKSLFELEIKYETEKKEKELLIAKTQKIETEFELSKTRNWVYILTFCIILIGLLALIATQARKRKIQEEKIRQKNEAFNAIIEAQEEERNRIARELHDGVVQQIGSVILRSRKIFKEKDLLHESDAQAFMTNLENSNQDLRTISHQMMPRALKEFGVVAALNDLFDFSFSATKIEYTFEHFNLNERLSQKIEITVYRITQELINNVIKHSQASSVSFQLFRNTDSLILIAEDNGIGFPKQSNLEGVGMINIKSRLHLINGAVNFENLPEKGALITIKIPLENAN